MPIGPTSHVRFVSQDDLVESYKARGETIPPFIVFTPYVVRDGVEGYLLGCDADAPGAELWGEPQRRESTRAANTRGYDNTRVEVM